MSKEKNIEDLLGSIYNLVQEARNEQKIISYNSSNQEIKKNKFFDDDTNQKKVFIEKTDSYLGNKMNIVKDNEKHNEETEIIESKIISKFKFNLIPKNWGVW